MPRALKILENYIFYQKRKFWKKSNVPKKIHELIWDKMLPQFWDLSNIILEENKNVQLSN